MSSASWNSIHAAPLVGPSGQARSPVGTNDLQHATPAPAGNNNVTTTAYDAWRLVDDRESGISIVAPVRECRRRRFCSRPPLSVSIVGARSCRSDSSTPG